VFAINNRPNHTETDMGGVAINLIEGRSC